ncbi:MAG: glycosyltransferase family 4 protein [Leptolyngbya sp. UWPOB_LEPTO1]|uniref:glycosyltransferase family 4 protein n=1 Tax=Leptolyngbya sp. UWPOB_LEPTO1 TaxID=2815653 RepID=UPI001ACF0E1B|nr:glycosyltransferase family 4 protein [Leptolyngbya sp. UWPOB_LEPTO1]MBN8559060.1 glycosyltransferase family 4 protein [Leptolyngbya sp. UWPOB_LEPTO1]
MKVSILTPNFAKGGVDRAYLLAQVLKTLNHQVEILGFLFGEKIYPEPPTDLPIVCLPGGQYPQFFKTAAQLINRIDGDLIYAVKPKPTSFGVGLLKKMRSQIPVMLDIDDWELSWIGEKQYRPGLRQFGRDLLKKDGALRSPDHFLYLQWMEEMIQQADSITVDTTFLQKRFGGTYLPNGKDTDMFDPSRFDAEASRQKYGLSEYRVLMFPGASRPHKGLEDVLVALEKLNQPDLRLVIVGGSPYDDYDRHLLDTWGNWVIKIPPVPFWQMPEIVAAAHVVVVPQRDTVTAQAQFPIKLTEGMSMAKPILATRVGDIPEILAGTGFLVDPQSPDQIAEKLNEIFQDWDAAQVRGNQARERCLAHYSVEAMAPIVENLLSQIV